MKSKLLRLAFVLFVSFVVNLHAETLKLTINDVFRIDLALSQLDAGVTTLIKPPAPKEGEEPGQPREVRTAYDFSAATRLAIYRNKRALGAELEDFRKGQQGIIKKIWGDKSPDLEHERTAATEEWKRYEPEINKLAAASVSVDVTILKVKDLIYTGNPLPYELLKALEPLAADKP